MLDIEEIHKQACDQGNHTYIDPNTGLTVFTSVSHRARGTCCGCGCRHCPFKTSCDTKCATPSTTTTSKKQKTNTISLRKKNKVYTTTGDRGTSSLFTGERVKKDDCIFEALGTVDELNSFIGLAHDQLEKESLQHPLLPFLQRIMKVLLSLGSSIATPPETASARQLKKSIFDKNNTHVDTVETWIDQLTEALPDLRTFVLPYGGITCSTLHVCRSVCRRAERRVIAVKQIRNYKERMDVGVKFLNRLSDFLFVAARYACYYSKQIERTYMASEVNVNCELFEVPLLAGRKYSKVVEFGDGGEEEEEDEDLDGEVDKAAVSNMDSFFSYRNVGVALSISVLLYTMRRYKY